MERKERYLFAEFLITYFLLLIITFLFGEKIANYRVYLAAGLVAGFIFSWYTKNKPFALTRYGINIAFAAVSFWVIYSVWHSSFSYNEVILIFIQGGIFLEIILSFDSSNPSSLTYLQTLSLPLFMCFPAFVKQYDNTHIILVLAYFIGWAVILKVKFYESFKPIKNKAFNRYYSFIMSVLLFALIVFISWEFFQHILLGKIEKGGLLLDESGEVKIKEDAKEKEFYESQDDLQNRITRLIPDFEYKEDRHETLYMLSSLLKESTDTMEVKKAEKGLIDKLNRPGPGLEPSEREEMTVLIKDYVDKKISISSQRARSNIMSSIKSNPFSIEQRMTISGRINKMQDSASRQELNEHARAARDAINNSLVSKSAKSQMNGAVQSIKELKTFQLYRQQMDNFNKKAGSLGAKAKEEFENISSAIDNAENVSDLAQAQERLEKGLSAASAEHKDMIKQLEEILKLKSDMVLTKQAAKIKDKLSNSELSQSSAKELAGMVDEISGAQEPKELSDGVSQLQEKAQANNVGILQELKELLEMKAHLFSKESKERVKEMLKEGVLPDSGKELVKNIEKMESRKQNEKLDSDFRALKDQLEKLYNQGFISEGTKDKLLKEIEGLKDLYSLKLKAEEEMKNKELPEAGKETNYQQELKDLIDNSSLKENDKEILQELAEGLFKAQTLLQLENTKEGVNRQLKDCLKQGASKEETEEISKGFDAVVEIQKKFIIDAVFSGIREKIEDLKKSDPQQAEKIKEQLEKMRNSSNTDDLKKQMEALKEYLKSQAEAQGKEKEKSSDDKSASKKSDLQNQMNELREAMLSSLKSSQPQPQQEKSSSDMQKDMEKSIKESSMPADKKDNLEQLLKEMLQSESLTALQDSKLNMEKELENLSKQGAKKQEMEELKAQLEALAQSQKQEMMKKEFANLQKEMDKLKEMSSQQAEKIKEQLEKIKQSAGEKETKEKIEKLKEAIDAKAKESEEKQKEGAKDESPWEVYVLPVRVVLAAGNSVSLKAIAVYNKVFIKELNSDVEWFSSNPKVVEVNRSGKVSALSAGRARVGASYKGKDSELAEILVVGRTPAETEGIVKKEIGARN